MEYKDQEPINYFLVHVYYHLYYEKKNQNQQLMNTHYFMNFISTIHLLIKKGKE